MDNSPSTQKEIPEIISEILNVIKQKEEIYNKMSMALATEHTVNQ